VIVDRRRRIDQFEDHRPRRNLRRLAVAGDREFGAGTLRGDALAERGTGAVVEGRIADIRDRERVMRLMDEFKPDIMFHAAALKHVPILERDWSEGVKTNIFGSVNVADAALAAGAEAMVMISTDKAIEPVSMLGLTKRFAEMYCQALDRDLARSDGKPRMRLISVRFGNVLASNGSVVPKFKAQIETGGPVTVTHPDMVRYFMTIREACDLVLTAATHALAPTRPDVSVYVLNMGQPVKIVELAERMIRLSGLEPGIDIEVVFTGMRPRAAERDPVRQRGRPWKSGWPASWRPSRMSRRCRRCANGSRRWRRRSRGMTGRRSAPC
jgi:O-antigen biosynthesis protein WbqV